MANTNTELKPGLRAEATEEVTARNTASVWGSGGLDVYATPAMAALMEKASVLAVAPLLDGGASTVGTELSIRHLSPTAIGASVRAESVLTAVEGRVLRFEVRAWDKAGLIGEGTHARVIIDNIRFMDKARAKTGD
jgi:predicted thioesterase